MTEYVSEGQTKSYASFAIKLGFVTEFVVYLCIVLYT